VSTVTVWRIATAVRETELFSGNGGLYVSGRWHPVGVRMVYASESRALAALEIMVNVPERAQLNRHAWVIAAADIPSSLISKPDRFPLDWRSIPSGDATRALGKAWLKSAESPALRVPSAVILGEFNYLLNPLHPDFAKIKLHPPQPFAFDARF